jgi:hypothetical protein
MAAERRSEWHLLTARGLVFVGLPGCIPVKSRMWRTSYMAKKVNDKSRF